MGCLPQVYFSSVFATCQVPYNFSLYEGKCFTGKSFAVTDQTIKMEKGFHCKNMVQCIAEVAIVSA